VVVHKIVVIVGEEAIFIVSRNTDGWILETSSDVVTKINTHVFRNNVLGFSRSLVFDSINIYISLSSFQFPIVGNIVEVPFRTTNITNF
jgi:hypothetical protein